MTDLDKLQRRIQGLELIRRSGCTLLVLEELVTEKASFLICYPYYFHRTSMDEVPETLGDLSAYGF